MQSPVIVYRDRTISGAEVVTTIPLDEFLDMQQAAWALMVGALRGDPACRQLVEQTFGTALNHSIDNRGRAVVAAYLLRHALAQAEMMRQQMQQQPQQWQGQPQSQSQPQQWQGQPPPQQSQGGVVDTQGQVVEERPEMFAEQEKRAAAWHAEQVAAKAAAKAAKQAQQAEGK